MHVRDPDADLWHAVADEKSICLVFRCQIHPGSSKCKLVYGFDVLRRAGGLVSRGCYIFTNTIFNHQARMALEQIPIVGAEIYYDGQFLGTQEASEFFDALLSKCPWERRKTSFGSAVPRDEAYYGDPGTHYEYSRREYKPLPWITEFFSLKQRVEAATPIAAYENLLLPAKGYDAVLCNLYRDGSDSVGLHADNELEMGPSGHRTRSVFDRYAIFNSATSPRRR